MSTQNSSVRLTLIVVSDNLRRVTFILFRLLPPILEERLLPY
jgi:hypothetical protein